MYDWLMTKFFNIAGPCIPGDHYMLDPMRGIGDELMELIDSKQYFLIHAARQSGKTTLMQALASHSDTGWLVIFDRNTEKPWDEKIYMKEKNLNGKRIVLAGC